ncbi:MAG: glycosyltransferase family 4 protein [Pseudonocardiales bacterium]|nr:MAG: glycosyltransferase family 4 protein [Pseudonocardiales bacterium]
MRIALIASARYPIRQPFAGGLEAHTWALARGLRQRGHEVTVFGGTGCDPDLDVRLMLPDWPRLSDAARADTSMTAEAWLGDHHAYLQLVLELADRALDDFDVVHNNSLHHLPVAMARVIPIPMITTLHTPPTPWLESAIQVGACPVTFVAVSAHTARAWRHLVTARVIRNGVDLKTWQPGPGGDSLIWTGRLVREKGPDLAIQAALAAGLELDLVGPVPDAEYFAAEIEPHLGPQIRYLGHRGHAELSGLVGSAAAALVTPRWDEPYGLVAAEALACATPVAGFARGALSEVLDDSCAVLVPAGDVAALACAARDAAALPRWQARSYAQTYCSVERMVDQYTALYHELVDRVAA